MITRKVVSEHQRINHTADLFGLDFPLHVEPWVYALTDRLASEYQGSYWEFYELSNGGFYMAPQSDTPFQVSCENGFEGLLSAEALGITVCLYAYSQLSFSAESRLATTCARQYYLLRDYMLEHPEAGAILAAID
ncbi:MAG: antirestriction protein [Methylomicrobium sp.]